MQYFPLNMCTHCTAVLSWSVLRICLVRHTENCLQGYLCDLCKFYTHGGCKDLKKVQEQDFGVVDNFVWTFVTGVHKISPKLGQTYEIHRIFKKTNPVLLA